MSSSAAHGHRGLAFAAAALVAVMSCALTLTSSSGTPAGEPPGPGVTAAGGAGTASGDPAAPTSGPSAEGASTDGGGIFLAADTEEVASDERGVARSRTVEIDTAVLPDDAAEAAHELELALFDDTTVVANLSAPTSRADAGYRTWSGTIDGDEGSTVVLVEQAGVLSGLVTSKDATYRLRPMSDGSTRIEEIDESEFPTAYAHATPPSDGGFTPVVTADDSHSHAPGTPEHSHEPASSGEEHGHAPGTPEHSHEVPPAATRGDSGGAATGDAPETSAATADAPVIDVLVAYSSAAKTFNGGQAGMDAEVALMIEQTNTAFGSSGINAVLRLARTAEVALNGPVDGATLGKLANPSDGVYDELHVLRDQYGADLVALITTSPSGPYRGIAYQ